MLAHLGQADQAMEILLTLAREVQVSKAAIEALGRVGDTRCLPELEALAQVGQPNEIRATANEAANQIRSRKNLSQ